MFAFPTGVLIGSFYDKIKTAQKWALKRRNAAVSLGVLILILVFIARIVLNSFQKQIVPITSSIIFYLVNTEIFGLVITISLMTVLSLTQITSKFLDFIGKYSYAIFLVHVPLMLNYDFILFRGPLYITVWIYFAMIVLIAVILQKYVFSKAIIAVSNKLD
jgi:peptidoglycan/LPS O-acetylase OafA/YrhL